MWEPENAPEGSWWLYFSLRMRERSLIRQVIFHWQICKRSSTGQAEKFLNLLLTMCILCRKLLVKYIPFLDLSSSRSFQYGLEASEIGQIEEDNDIRLPWQVTGLIYPSTTLMQHCCNNANL